MFMQFFGDKKKTNFVEKLKLKYSYVHRTNQTLDKHVGDSTDSDNEEKEGRIYIKIRNKIKK